MAGSGKICVLGAGSMGLAVSCLLSEKGYTVCIWTPFDDEAFLVNEKRGNEEKLPGLELPLDIVCTTDIELALNDVSMVVVAVPSQKLSDAITKASQFIKKTVTIACFTKGLEEKTGSRMSQVIRRQMPWARPVALSGPCHAEELVCRIPSAYVSACENIKEAVFVQDVFMTPYFRVYTNPDLTGVELGGALKNVIAICAGISDGLGCGDNTKAALMTRGIAEISRLGVAMGANPGTFSGLAGIGDLIVTCTSKHSRNRKAGMLIGSGCSLAQALQEVKMVVEGVSTAKAAMELAIEHEVDMPITFEANKVLFKGKSPRKAVYDLMTRSKKQEIDDAIGTGNG